MQYVITDKTQNYYLVMTLVYPAWYVINWLTCTITYTCKIYLTSPWWHSIRMYYRVKFDNIRSRYKIMQQNTYNTLSRKCIVSTYGVCVILWSYPSKFIELVSLKVRIYTHAELKPNMPTYLKPEPHQTMLIQLVQNHGNHIAMTM